MNKDKLIEKINYEINEIVEQLPRTVETSLDKVIDGGLRFGLYCYQKSLEIIQSEPEETCVGCIHNTGTVEDSADWCFVCKRGYSDEYEKAGE